MKGAPWFPLHAERFLLDTAEMDPDVGFAYALLMAYAWRKGGLPTDLESLCRLGRLSLDRKHLLEQVLQANFEILDGKLVLPWQEERRDRIGDVSEKRRQAGALGGKRRAENERSRQANAQALGQANASANGTANAQAIAQAEILDRLDREEISNEISSAAEGLDEFGEPVKVRRLSAVPDPVDDPKAPAPRQKRRPALDESAKAANLAAYTLLDALYPVVIAGVGTLTMTRQKWRDANKDAALDMVKAGVTADEATKLLRVAYEHPEAKRFHGQMTMLRKLQEHSPKLRALLEPEVPKRRYKLEVRQ